MNTGDQKQLQVLSGKKICQKNFFRSLLLWIRGPKNTIFAEIIFADATSNPTFAKFTFADEAFLRILTVNSR